MFLRHFTKNSFSTILFYKVLHNLVKMFPMVAFHQTTQRLAVGTQKAVIIIWDLKTATRWHVLEVCHLLPLSCEVFGNPPYAQQGHRGPVTAIAFNSRGDMLASYSVADGRVLFWNTKPSITHIFSSPACVHSTVVSKVTSTQSLHKKNKTLVKGDC